MLELLADSQIWSSVQIVQGLSDPKPPFGCAKQTNWQIPRSKNKTETNLLESENKVLAALPKKKSRGAKAPPCIGKSFYTEFTQCKATDGLLPPPLVEKGCFRKHLPLSYIRMLHGRSPQKNIHKTTEQQQNHNFSQKILFLIKPHHLKQLHPIFHNCNGFCPQQNLYHNFTPRNQVVWHRTPRGGCGHLVTTGSWRRQCLHDGGMPGHLQKRTSRRRCLKWQRGPQLETTSRKLQRSI